MDIAHKLNQVAVFLAQDGFIPVLKQVAVAAMPAIANGLQIFLVPVTARFLKVRDLTLSFATDEGLVTAVENVDLDIEPGEVLGLVGESGSAKSVTSYALMRILDAGGVIRTGDEMLGPVDHGAVWCGYLGMILLSMSLIGI